MFPHELFPPRYFPSEGWGAGRTHLATEIALPGASYWPPRFWSPAYYAADYWSGAGLSVAACDRAIFREIKKALEASCSFDAVLLHQPLNHARATADRNPIITVRRTGWDEQSLCGYPTIFERTVAYQATIAVREEDSYLRFETLQQLEDLALNSLDGQSWAGLCLPHKSLVRRGADDTRAGHPEQHVTLEGQFVYLLTGYSARNAST